VKNQSFINFLAKNKTGLKKNFSNLFFVFLSCFRISIFWGQRLSQLPQPLQSEAIWGFDFSDVCMMYLENADILPSIVMLL